MDIQEDNISATISVKRGNKLIDINLNQLLVGDIINLKEGEVWPADVILLEGNEVYVDETEIINDHNEIEKNSIPEDLNSLDYIIDPFILYKSKIVAGEGKCIVCAIGSDTVYGQDKYIYHPEKESLIKSNVSLASEYNFRFTLLLSYICFSIVNVRYVYLYYTQNNAYKQRFYDMNICLNCVVILCYLLIANFPTTFGFAEWLSKSLYWCLINSMYS